MKARALLPGRHLRRAGCARSAATRPARRSGVARLVLPLATMALALLFLSHHGLMVWESSTGPGHGAHSAAVSDGDHSADAFVAMEAGHGAPSKVGHPDCTVSKAGGLNSKTELALPAPLPVSEALLRPALLPPPPLFAHRPLPKPPDLAELSILRI